ncbi:MAG TPA: cytochrome d ubiquinol oxidase subunit II [Nitrospira sp.]|nr:cytochrome d ubiquinol oxidase subunit II [Nitrospira sp.]
METFWYGAVAFMLTVYIVLDGYDFGVGIVYPFVARTEADREATFAAIGPVWNGNEVWLIGGGALLFFAFPKAYAAGFSGFYLALIIVLWLLILRGLAIELRSHVDHPLWKQGWDWAFSAASFLLAFVFGAALGNLIRGVPINGDGYFFIALWTDFLTGPRPAILDWFTVSTGMAAVAIIALHGLNYLAMKCEGELYRRASSGGAAVWWAAAGSTVAMFVAISFVQPTLQLNVASHPWESLAPLTGVMALGGTLLFRRRGQDVAAFLGSSLFILAMLSNVAIGMYPNLLMSSVDPAFNLTAFNAATDAYGMAVGLRWFLIGFTLLVVYQIYAHRAFCGKVRPAVADREPIAS